jgi:hypothetical protein
VNRTQIYLTEQQAKQLRATARATGKTQSTLIREAIDASFLVQRAKGWQAALATLRGIWQDRKDLPELRQLRQESEQRLTRAHGDRS